MKTAVSHHSSSASKKTLFKDTKLSFRRNRLSNDPSSKFPEKAKTKRSKTSAFMKSEGDFDAHVGIVPSSRIGAAGRPTNEIALHLNEIVESLVNHDALFEGTSAT